MKLPSTEIVARPPSNELLPKGSVWKTKPESSRSNPPRKHAPRTRLGDFFQLS